jgi:hypothetical protein
LEQASFRVICTCEGSFDVSEQLRLNERGSQGRTIDWDQRLFATRSREVNGSRYQFFSGSALSRDQHRGSALANFCDQLIEMMHWSRLTDQPGKAGSTGQRRAGEVRVVFHSF